MSMRDIWDQNIENDTVNTARKILPRSLTGSFDAQ